MRGQQFSIGCSIGLVTVDANNSGLADIMKRADGACYLAKEKGRGRIQLAALGASELDRRQQAASWVPKIQEAVYRDQFCLYAQTISPIFAKGKGDYLEVLVRYRSRTGEVINPGTFCPLPSVLI